MNDKFQEVDGLHFLLCPEKVCPNIFQHIPQSFVESHGTIKFDTKFDRDLQKHLATQKTGSNAELSKGTRYLL